MLINEKSSSPKKDSSSDNVVVNYSTNSYTYPSDLLSNEYGNNYAMFFINVQSESKLSMPMHGGDINNLLNTVDVVTGTAGSMPTISEASAIRNIVVQALVGGGILGALTAQGEEKSKALKTAGVAGGVAAALAAVTAMGAGKFSQPVKRLKTAIALHMPTDLSIRYSVNYEETDTMMMAALNEVSNLNLGNTSSVFAAYGLKELPNSGALQKLSKTAPNPMKEQIFKSVDFRTFVFNYRFAPRNENEAKNVLNIIDQFKFHMHPEFKDDAGFLYIFPSEFDIVYYAGGDQNTNVHKHTSCVLTEVSLNYAPNGVFTTFANGMPTQINMQLTFKELASLDKKKIQSGGF